MGLARLVGQNGASIEVDGTEAMGRRWMHECLSPEGSEWGKPLVRLFLLTSTIVHSFSLSFFLHPSFVLLQFASRSWCCAAAQSSVGKRQVDTPDGCGMKHS